MICEGSNGPCGNPGASPRPHLTAYESNTTANRPILCDECFADYAEYWQMMWAEYYASQGIYV